MLLRFRLGRGKKISHRVFPTRSGVVKGFERELVSIVSSERKNQTWLVDNLWLRQQNSVSQSTKKKQRKNSSKLERADFYGILHVNVDERKLKRAEIPKTDWFVINIFCVFLSASIRQSCRVYAKCCPKIERRLKQTSGLWLRENSIFLLVIITPMASTHRLMALPTRLYHGW